MQTSEKLFSRFDIILFIVLLIYFLFYPFYGFYYMHGDNICQVAYWKILSRPHLMGSIAASQTKPGLMLLLGCSYDISNLLFDSPDILIRVLLSFFAAFLCFMIGRIATDIGGKIAGISAALFSLSSERFIYLFQIGSSHIFFLSLIFLGIWLFYRKREGYGAFILSWAIFIRIEAAGVLMLLILYQLINKKWIAASRSCVFAGLAIIFDFAIVGYAVQGSLDRIAGSFSTGRNYENIFMLGNLNLIIKNMIHQIGCYLFSKPYYPFAPLALAALIAFLSIKTTRIYTSLTGIMMVIALHAYLTGGNIVAEYFSFLIPAIIAIGTGGIFYIVKTITTPAQGKYDFVRIKRIYLALIAIPTVILLIISGWHFQIITSEHIMIQISVLAVSISVILGIAGLLSIAKIFSNRLTSRHISTFLFMVILGYTVLFTYNNFKEDFNNPPPLSVFVNDGLEFVQNPYIPEGVRLIGDDELLYVVLTKRPDYFSKIFAIQTFNVMNEENRERILRDFDYIWLPKSNYGYYYLKYVPVPQWRNDPFRRTVHEIIKTDRPVIIYKSKLVPVVNSPSQLVIKIVHNSLNLQAK